MSYVRPICCGCDGLAAKGRLFCTIKCAADYGEALMRGNEDQYCPTCGEWSHRDVEDEAGNTLLICGHIATGITEGMGHKEATRLYDAALAAAKERTRAHTAAPSLGDARKEGCRLKKTKPIKLTDSQWDLLLRTAQANEAHAEPPRLKGAMHATAGALVRMGLLEESLRRCTTTGWFFVRDEISRGRTDRCVNCARPRSEHPTKDRAACRGFVSLNGHVSATAGTLIAATDCACPVHPDAPRVG